jgi:ABC-type transport system involved in cytochrome c biogenesis permease subunit
MITRRSRRYSELRGFVIISGMKDLTSSTWIKCKGMLFLLLGLTSAVLLYAEQQSLRTVLLLAICIWSFCRFYYFAFYVIEHYVDPGYRFSGLLSFARYMAGRRGGKNDKGPTSDKTV